MPSKNNNQEAPDINTNYPGFVYNFNPVDQTCDVQIAIENLFVGYEVPYTLKDKQMLQKVPVQFIQGGGWSFTHPVPDGTPCTVEFSQRGIDHWLFDAADKAGMDGEHPNYAFNQLFSHDSAVCKIGTQPIPMAIKDFNNSVAELRNADRGQRVSLHGDGLIEVITGAAKIVVTKDSKIEIEVNTQATVKAPNIKLDGIVTVTKALIVQGGMSVSGGSGDTMSLTGNLKITGATTQVGSMTINGVRVDGHNHISNSPGSDTGAMKNGG